jgi:hypothetical protein
MARKARFTPEEMSAKWEQYKRQCDNRSVKRTRFWEGSFISAEVPACVTYTIEGFCIFLGLRKSSFYATYASPNAELWPEFEELITRIRDEVELDARQKFETGAIPTRLAGLWMARYGYTVKTETKCHGASVCIVDSDIQTDDYV